MYFTSLIAYIVIAQIVASFIRVILEQWSKRTGKASDSPNFLVHLGVTLVSVGLFFSNYALELTKAKLPFSHPASTIRLKRYRMAWKQIYPTKITPFMKIILRSTLHLL